MEIAKLNYLISKIEQGAAAAYKKPPRSVVFVYFCLIAPYALPLLLLIPMTSQSRLILCSI